MAQTLEQKRVWSKKDYQQKRSKNWTLKDHLKHLIWQYKTRKELTYEILLEIYKEQEGKCAFTGIELTYIRGQGKVKTNISIDRIEAGGPYIKENIQLVCSVVNKMKSNMSDDEFKWWCNAVSKYEKGIV